MQSVTGYCWPVRLGPLRWPPGEEGCPARTRQDQRTGSSGLTPGSSSDWRGVTCSSGSSNGGRRTRPQTAGGRSGQSGPVSIGRTPLREARRRDAICGLLSIFATHILQCAVAACLLSFVHCFPSSFVLRSITFKFPSCSLRIIRPTLAPPLLIATLLHPETYPCAR